MEIAEKCIEWVGIATMVGIWLWSLTWDDN